ncbi:MAG: protein-L-isoaspartate(D-aspartate) O-methyltransferase [bacterium]|jgi:protein-L-isoaspartate(D-aspartate) O-methyltransferase
MLLDSSACPNAGTGTPRRFVRLLTAAGLLSALSAAAGTQEARGRVAESGPEADARERMVQTQIANRGIRDARVLAAMRAVPRHLFVPEELRRYAYSDSPLPIGLGQTISQPYIVAYMTELLDVKPDMTVLEIGTGSGYQAAVLAHLARRVYSIEIVPELARSAAALLRKLGYANVVTRTGDGYRGWPEQAPFDRIILTAAPPEVPQALINQLRPGGRLVAPVGGSPLDQELVLIEKSKTGKLTRRGVLPVRFVPMVPGPE